MSHGCRLESTVFFVKRSRLADPPEWRRSVAARSVLSKAAGVVLSSVVLPNVVVCKAAAPVVDGRQPRPTIFLEGAVRCRRQAALFQRIRGAVVVSANCQVLSFLVGNRGTAVVGGLALASWSVQDAKDGALSAFLPEDCFVGLQGRLVPPCMAGLGISTFRSGRHPATAHSPVGGVHTRLRQAVEDVRRQGPDHVGHAALRGSEAGWAPRGRSRRPGGVVPRRHAPSVGP